MAQKRIRKQKPKSKKEEAPEEEKGASSNTSKIIDEIEDILDMIDAVLEENAQEFVDSYIQKGGQ